MSYKNNRKNINEEEKPIQFSIDCITKYWKDQQPPKNSREKFTDPLFPPNKNSLMSLNPKTGKPIDLEQYERDSHEIPEEKLSWKRATEIFPECLLFEDEIVAGDIMQGSLGNCYFLSAIAAITEFPNLIHKIFKTNTLNESGYYEIALFIDGEWQIVIVDDYLPYDKDNDNAAFTQANGQEIWVLMLEKAWAKINGGYLNIIGGLSSDPLLALTGFHTRRVDTSIETNELWKTLQTADDHNSIMCCDSKANEEGLKRNLVKSHAYTLIGTHEETYKGKLIRLCQVRNPWGNKEWNGDWSDKSPLWDDYLKQKFCFKSFKDDEWNDGTFFISLEDLQEYFSLIHICSYMYGSNTRTLEIKKEHFHTPSIFGLINPHEHELYCSISTHGQNWRYNRDLKNKDIPINICLARVEENNELTYIDSYFSSSEDPFIIRPLPKGYYNILVYYGVDDSNRRYLNDFNLKISTNCNFKADFINFDQNFTVMNKIILNGLTQQKSEDINSKPLFMFIENDFEKSGFGYFYMSNKSKKTHMRSKIEWPKMEGYKMLPPLNEKNNTTLFCTPGEEILVIGMKTRDCGSFWYNISDETASRSGPFEENSNKKSNSEIDFPLYDKKILDDYVIKDYYQYVAPDIDEAKISQKFPSLDIYEISKKNLTKKFPEKMKMVLQLHDISYEKHPGRILWKKIPALNGFYICEYHEKEGIFGRAIFTFDDNSYFKGIYEKSIREGYFEEFTENHELVFKGNYSGGKRNGKGIAYFEDGSEYEGNFVDNEKTGLGKYRFPKGAYYEGEFKKNTIYGRGKYFFKENEYWEGNFVNGKKEGEGIYHFQSGKTRVVSFKDNKLIKN